MSHAYVVIEQSPALQGTVGLVGAKNAVLVIMASLILTNGVSRLTNVPSSDDVYQMIALLRNLGAIVFFDSIAHTLEIDTTAINAHAVNPEIMKKMRASILVMGPLLARYGKASIALPGGCLIGARPIDYHLKAFVQMGATIDIIEEYLNTQADALKACKFILEYPSVGATENIMMAATLIPGKTSIVNAAIEPEILDLVTVLRKMGASITLHAPATIEIEGVKELHPIEHDIIPDRLEAGSLLAAVAMTGGSVTIPDAPVYALEVFLEKLSEMGHTLSMGKDGKGISLTSTKNPKAVSFKTMPYPGFPTDLQAPMMVLQTIASGTSVIYETVFENRLMHVRELQKMGAHITVEGGCATIKGVDALYGASVIAPDIRASAGLVIAGLVAQGQTVMTGVHHLKRGYEELDKKLALLGAHISMHTEDAMPTPMLDAQRLSHRVQ